MKSSIPIPELEEHIKQLVRDEEMSPVTRELLLLLGAVIKGTSTQVEKLQAEHNLIKAERDQLRRKLYGKKTEKSTKVVKIR